MLRGKEGEEAHTKFPGHHPLQPQAEAQPPFFSQEAFHDALVQFTVATDQVSFYFIFFLIYFYFI